MRASQHNRAIAAAMTIAIAMVACKGDHCDTPFGAGGTIDLSTAEYMNLYNVGGTADVNRGHRGIIVRCESIGSYVAFEMSCPNCRDVRMQPDDADYAILMQCPVCQSQFDIVYGNPVEGAATPCPLYQYSTTFDGRMLSIW